MTEINYLGSTPLQALQDVGQRVHLREQAGREDCADVPENPFDVLWTRKRVADSPLADHVTAAQAKRKRGEAATWLYTPDAALRALREDPASFGSQFEPWSRACAEMTDHACLLLKEINQARCGQGTGQHVWSSAVQVGDDLAGAILARARTGSNRGRSTKSNPGFCTSRQWANMMDEFGLAGAASLPTVALGSWWMVPLTNDYRDWRLDYTIMLGSTFFFEYNVDTASFGGKRAKQVLQDLNALWDMPGLSPELQVRRMHMLSSMAFFDTKRRDEAAAHAQATDGLTAWVHHDRDWWRDFKSLDSGAWANFLGFAKGTPGRDDMMLCGLTNDWVDLGPDLRNDECNQSVLALTRGSLTMSALLEAYERSVWMMNEQLTADATIKPARAVGSLATIGTCLWEMCNHRHDVWRYYAIGVEACAEARARDLYKSVPLAECYDSDFTPRDAVGAPSLKVPRRSIPYEVTLADKRYVGEVNLHTAVCDAVDAGVLPMDVVTYTYVIPMLLRNKEISSTQFLSYMDLGYCANFVAVMRSGHASDFSDLYSAGVAALVMEQWWCGMFFGIGVGSLIEAQPGAVANDRAH
ncbi:hypothetical protein [Streptomyces collinus]|uniref:hypothetical protein n=1 Tax=Streptomyces collinus TaxID=42684 RepID=UPI00369389B9